MLPYSSELQFRFHESLKTSLKGVHVCIVLWLANDDFFAV